MMSDIVKMSSCPKISPSRAGGALVPRALMTMVIRRRACGFASLRHACMHPREKRMNEEKEEEEGAKKKEKINKIIKKTRKKIEKYFS